jgi:hypothetical protein
VVSCIEDEMRQLVLPLVGVLLAGCADEPPSAALARADSAGIEIVSNHAPLATLPVLAVSSSPSIEFGSDPTGPTLYDVRAVVLLGDGSVAVGNNGSKSVVVFGPTANAVAEMGREGDGPGEFNAIEGVVAASDSLLVYDPTLKRLTVFSQTGALGRTTDLRNVAPEFGWSELLKAEGALIVLGTGGIGPDRNPGVYRWPSPARSITLGGSLLASYGEFPGAEFFIGEQGLGMLPFGARLFAATTGEMLVVGRAEESELEYYEADGSLRRIVRWPDHAREVSDADFEAYLEAEFATIPAEQRAAVRARLGTIPHADRAPPYQDLVATDEGLIWVGDYPGQGAIASQRARTWIVIGTDGSLRARVETPAGFQPHLVRGGLVYGVFKDDLGVESVRAYELGS